MQTGSQETTQTRTLSISDENISQADYERLRAGEKVEVEEVSAPVEDKPAGETTDESETSESEDKAEAEGDSELDESEEVATESVKPKKKSGTQRRIEKLVKKNTEVARERDYYRELYEKSKSSAEKPEQPAVAQASIDGKPKEDDFDSHAEYVAAVARWEVRQELAAEKAKAKETELKTEHEKRVSAHIERVNAFVKEHADFNEVIEDVDDIKMSLTVQEVILGSDNGPALMYELAKNREEFERINALPAIDAARELGRFEARLSKPSEEKKPEVKKTTKAPPPARPLNTSSASGKKSIYDDDVSQAEYERMREEQERKRRASF